MNGLTLYPTLSSQHSCPVLEVEQQHWVLEVENGKHMWSVIIWKVESIWVSDGIVELLYQLWTDSVFKPLFYNLIN